MTPPFSQLAPGVLKYEFDGSLLGKLHKHTENPHMTMTPFSPLAAEDIPPEQTSRRRCRVVKD